MSRTLHSCSECDYSSNRYANLKRHVLTKHGATLPLSPRMTAQRFSCDICSKKYGSEETLARHRRLLHKIVSRTSRLQCPSCEATSPTQEKLSRHYALAHSDRHEIISAHLENMDVFKRWLKAMQLETGTSFYVRRKRNISNTIYYRCTYATRYRAKKSGNAMPPTCTAFVKAVITSVGEVDISYCAHHSHDIKPKLQKFKCKMENQAFDERCSP